jgi:excisionase family DNA binding protein
MLTVRDIAARAGVSANLVYGWCASGELPHYRLGAGGRRGKIMIAEEDWAAFVAARRVGGIAPCPATPAAGAPSEDVPLRHLSIGAKRPGKRSPTA